MKNPNLLTNTHFYFHCGTHSTLEEEEEKKVAKSEGKRVVNVCCQRTKDILTGALYFGLSKTEFDFFKRIFNEHKLTTFGTCGYRIGKTVDVDVNALVDDIFEKASLFDRPKLKEYFLDAIYQDMYPSNTNPGWSVALMKFNKVFEEKRRKENVATKKTKQSPKGEKLTFEGLFAIPATSSFAIRAMKEVEPKPLLNSDGKPILFGKATVAPVMALADVLFARKLLKDSISQEEAYRVICNRFSFLPVSDRPDKARKEGAGTYQDYKEGFQLFFLNNRPE